MILCLLRCTAVVCLVAFSACTTEKAEAPADGRSMLDAVYRSMGRVYSYHAVAVLEADGDRATIEGDFGVDRIRYTMERFDGEEMRVIVAGKVAYVSSGSDTSWSIDTTGGALAMSQLVTGPAGPRLGVTRDQKVVTIGTEQIDGHTTTHLRVERETPVDVWVGIDPKAGAVVHRVRLPSGAGPGSMATITYSDFNKYIEVHPPI